MFIQFDLGALIPLGLAHFRSLYEIPFRQGWVALLMLLQGLVFAAGRKYPLAFFLSGGIFFSCFWDEQGSISSTSGIRRGTGELAWFLFHLLESNNETSSDLKIYRYDFVNKSFLVHFIPVIQFVFSYIIVLLKFIGKLWRQSSHLPFIFDLTNFIFFFILLSPG